MRMKIHIDHERTRPVDHCHAVTRSISLLLPLSRARGAGSAAKEQLLSSSAAPIPPIIHSSKKRQQRGMEERRRVPPRAHGSAQQQHTGAALRRQNTGRSIVRRRRHAPSQQRSRTGGMSISGCSSLQKLGSEGRHRHGTAYRIHVNIGAGAVNQRPHMTRTGNTQVEKTLARQVTPYKGDNLTRNRRAPAYSMAQDTTTPPPSK